MLPEVGAHTSLALSNQLTRVRHLLQTEGVSYYSHNTAGQLVCSVLCGNISMAAAVQISIIMLYRSTRACGKQGCVSFVCCIYSLFFYTLMLYHVHT